MQASPKSQSIEWPILPITTFSYNNDEVDERRYTSRVTEMRTYRLNITMDDVSRVEVFEPLGNLADLWGNMR